MLSGLMLNCLETDYAKSIYWVYGVVLKNEVQFDASEAIVLMHKEGIGTRPFFWPMHLQPVFHKMGLFLGEQYPIAERIARRGFYLPSGLSITDIEIETVVNKLVKILK